MYYKKFGSEVVVRLDEEEELIASITEVCRQCGITGGQVHGIGAAKELSLRVADLEKGTFIYKTLQESMEITSMSGNITQTEDGLYLHLHVTAADREMNIRGGHLISGIIGATAEIVITPLSGTLEREPANDAVLGRLKL